MSFWTWTFVVVDGDDDDLCLLERVTHLEQDSEAASHGSEGFGVNATPHCYSFPVSGLPLWLAS